MWKELLTSDDGGIKPWVTYGAIGLAILVVAYFAYAAWTSTDEAQEVTLMCITPDCGYKASRPLKLGERLPAECPKCHQKSVWPAFKCRKCGEPMVLNQDRGLKPPTICPNCGEPRQGP